MKPRTYALSKEVLEFRRKEKEMWDAATQLDWKILSSAAQLLEEKVAAIVAAGQGSVHKLHEGSAHFTTSEEYSGVVDKYVWGRSMQVEDDWYHMPCWGKWRFSSFSGVPSGQIHLTGTSGKVITSKSGAFPPPIVHVPPMYLNRQQLETYQILAEDSYSSNQDYTLHTGLTLEERLKLADIAAKLHKETV